MAKRLSPCLSYLLFMLVIGGQAQSPSDDIATHSPIPVSRLALSRDVTFGGYTQGFLEYTDEIGSKYRLCSSTSFFNAHAAELMCKYFNFTGGAVRLPPALDNSSFKQLGTLPTFTCNSTTTRFEECTAAPFLPRPNCPQNDAIYVKCYGEGSVRLVDGTSPNTGRLQIFLNDTWYNACSDNFKNPENIDTTCKLLGYPKNDTAQFKRVNATDFDSAGKRWAEPNVYMSYIACTRREELLVNCIGGKPVVVPNSSTCYDAKNDAAFVCGYGGSVAGPGKSSAGKSRVLGAALLAVCLLLLAMVA